eukprot:1497-Heterococcus_DN1.PRE.2
MGLTHHLSHSQNLDAPCPNAYLAARRNSCKLESLAIMKFEITAMEPRKRASKRCTVHVKVNTAFCRNSP